MVTYILLENNNSYEFAGVVQGPPGLNMPLIDQLWTEQVDMGKYDDTFIAYLLEEYGCELMPYQKTFIA